MIDQLVDWLLRVSTALVTPDWGVLVGLLPALVAVLGIGFLAWTAARFATAGPTSRGVRRVRPVAPAGLRIGGSSRLPFLAVVAAFVLVYVLFLLWAGLGSVFGATAST